MSYQVQKYLMDGNSSQQNLQRNNSNIPKHIKPNPFLSEVWQRVYSGGDAKIAICADPKAGSLTRVGKSSLGLRFGQDLDINRNYISRFNVDHVVFNWEEFQEALQKNNPIGTVIMCEEVQTWFNSRTFNTKQNLDILYKFSTGGVFRYIFLLTYPQFEAIDSQVRPLIHYEARVNYKDTQNRLIHYQPFKCFAGKKLSDPIYREAFYDYDGVQRNTLNFASVLPSQSLMDAYERRAYGVKKDIKNSKKKTKEDLKEEKRELRVKNRTDRAIAYADTIFPVLDSVRNLDGVISVSKIQGKVMVSTPMAYKIKEILDDREAQLRLLGTRKEYFAELDER